MATFATVHPEGVVVTVRVQPRARRNRISGVVENSLRIQVQTPPVDGRANQALIAFLCEIVGGPRSGIRILSGEKARTKRVLIRTDQAAKVIAALEASVAEESADRH